MIAGVRFPPTFDGEKNRPFVRWQFVVFALIVVKSSAK